MIYIFILFFLQIPLIFSNDLTPSFEGLTTTSNTSTTKKEAVTEFNKDTVEHTEIDNVKSLKKKVKYYINDYYPKKYRDILKISLGDYDKFESGINTISEIEVTSGLKKDTIAQMVKPVRVVGGFYLLKTKLQVRKEVTFFKEDSEINTLWHEVIHAIEYQYLDHEKSKPEYSKRSDKDYEERHSEFFTNLMNRIYGNWLNLVKPILELSLPDPLEKMSLQKLYPKIRKKLKQIESTSVSYESTKKDFFDGYSDEQFKADIEQFKKWSGVWMYLPDLHDF